MNKDVFISYRNDGEGNNFAARLFEALDAKDYSVYFNSNEQHSGSFPDRLKTAIENCKDFILIVSAGCLEGLRQARESDWVRSEILYAEDNNKNITPVYIGKTVVPERWEDYPEDIRFLFALQSVYLPEQFAVAPISDLLSKFISKPSKEEYKDVANGNAAYDLHLDFMETLKKAESGDAQAMFEIGCMYYHGFATIDDCDGEIDYTEASKWLEKSKKSDDQLTPYVNMLIGNLYYWGQMPYEDQSFEKALSYYQQASDLGLTGCLSKECHMKTQGFMRSFSESEIDAFYESVKDKCPGSVHYSMALYYINHGRFIRAINLLENIEMPFADSEYQLGLLYLRGMQSDPPSPDMPNAVEHFRNAADMGHIEATQELGQIYFRGTNGYRQNFKKAKKYYYTAATHGHCGSQYNYAWMCKNGIGGEKNVEEAIRFFEMAATGGQYNSMAELAQLYQEPVCRNYQKAFEWACKSAEIGDPGGEFILGNLLFFGRGCEADMNKAMKYYKKAFSRGIYQAKFMMERIEQLL